RSFYSLFLPSFPTRRSSDLFWFCALLSIFSFSAFLFGVPKVKSNQTSSFDVLGVLFMVLCVAGLLTIPTFINNFGLSSWMWIPSDRKSTRLNSSHVSISYAV